jgi:tetratricopeptide (TPR) repeat protein
MRRGAVLLACVLATSLACSKRKEPERCPEVLAGAPVEPALLAFLSRARAAHHRADDPEQRGDLKGAIRELEALLAGPSLPGNAPEAREVLADTRARLADLRSRSGDYDRAEADVAEGLRLVPETSYFRGHLFEVRGLSEERRSKALASAGDVANAAAAKNRALTAFQEAMEIQAAVIERTAPPR